MTKDDLTHAAIVSGLVDEAAVHDAESYDGGATLAKLDAMFAALQDPLPDTDSRLLGDLLAVIHGDGGHYRAEHGDAKAVADAIAKWSELMIRAQRADEPKRDSMASVSVRRLKQAVAGDRMTNERVSDAELVERIEAIDSLAGAGWLPESMAQMRAICVELQERRIEVEKYKAWAALCDVGQAVPIKTDPWAASAIEPSAPTEISDEELAELSCRFDWGTCPCLSCKARREILRLRAVNRPAEGT